MNRSLQALSVAEYSALALLESAVDLDRAHDINAFSNALAFCSRLWDVVGKIAESREWDVPKRSQIEFAQGARGGPGCNDARVHALAGVNRRVSAALIGGDIDLVRERAYAIWENLGRPQGEALTHWLLAKLEFEISIQTSAPQESNIPDDKIRKNNNELPDQASQEWESLQTKTNKILHTRKGHPMMNQFSAARERKVLDMAVIKFIAGGGKITKIEPIYCSKDKTRIVGHTEQHRGDAEAQNGMRIQP